MKQGRWPTPGALAVLAVLSGCHGYPDEPPSRWSPGAAQAAPALDSPSVGPRASVPDTRPRLISFDDLEIDLPAGQAFDESLLTERIRELDGRLIDIRGFMFPSFQQAGIREFVMVKNTQCRFGPGEPPHHVMLVVLRAGETTSFTVRPLALEGRFSLAPYTGPDGTVWALYRLDEARVR